MFFVVTMPLSLHAYSYNGYKVICENGRYGVAYGDIVCVFPQYDSLLIGKTEYKEGVFGAYEAGASCRAYRVLSSSSEFSAYDCGSYRYIQ